MSTDLQKLTDIGFKRVVNKLNPVPHGNKRQFVKCKKCKTKAYYDYIPYSLQNPIRYSECGHDLRQYYKPF